MEGAKIGEVCFDIAQPCLAPHNHLHMMLDVNQTVQAKRNCVVAQQVAPT